MPDIPAVKPKLRNPHFWRGWWPQYSESFCRMMETDDALRECDYECGWFAPYGFVAEAGCPVHD